MSDLVANPPARGIRQGELPRHCPATAYGGQSWEGRPVRVVLVDDHEMVLEGLKAMLARFTGRVRVVGQAASAEEAVSRLVAALSPDVVLVRRPAARVQRP